MKCSVWRRSSVALAGIVLMGPGVAFLKLSRMGNDPYTAMAIAVGDKLHINFGLILIGLNCLFFAIEWGLEKRLIGTGTFMNWFFVGPLSSGCEKAIRYVWQIQEGICPRLLLMFSGILLMSLACALYQTADMGVAPYDSLSIILAHKGWHQRWYPYWKCRAFTDILCVIAAFALGGLLGVGTLICAIGLGPFITFFSRNIASLLLYGQKVKVPFGDSEK